MIRKNCHEAREQVYLYLDREQLGWIQRTRIRYHLKRCTNCTDCFEFEVQLKAVIRRKSQEEAPAELIDRLRAFIQEHGSDEVGA